MEKILWALILFWNVENCFAPFEIGKRGDFGEKSVTNITGGRDVESENKRYRKWSVFNRKRDAIAGSVALVAQENKRYPDIIGLAEVENRWVVNQIARNTILASQDYGIVHHESPDSRGIDVALLYRRSTFRILNRRFIPITTENSFPVIGDSSTWMTVLEDTLHTREMLYVKGVLRDMDTLHIMVVHWPSKLGGEAAKRNRTLAATRLRNLCDSILKHHTQNKPALCDSACHTNDDSLFYKPVWHSPKIIVMGDFNAGEGDPALESLTIATELKFLTASVNENDVEYSTEPYKRGFGIYNGQVRGTYKYKGVWESIDRFYISSYFLENKEIWTEKAEIFQHPSLLEEDKVYLGVKPRRCFVGPRYNGGISDHLPVVLKLWALATAGHPCLAN